MELMITLVVGALLLTVAVPGFSSFQMNNRRVTYINELVSSLNLARSEAAKSNVTVAICPSADGANCSGNIYDNGWLVFRNNDADSPPAVDPGETVLRVHAGTRISGTSLRATGITTGLNYATTGRPNVSGEITYCDKRGAGNARNVIVSRVGLVTNSNVHTDGSALTCP